MGLFVIVQLSYLLIANALNILTSEVLGIVRDPALRARLHGPTSRWAGWTYQFQGWTQYAPYVQHQSGFATVELRWPADPAREPVKLLTEIEPADPSHFFRPFFQFRQQVFESWLTVAYWAWDLEFAARNKDEWCNKLQENFRGERRRYRDYMLWRAHGYCLQRATVPPGEIVFSVRLYALAPPGERPWSWRGPVEVPVTRWRFDGNWDTTDLPVELFDPFLGAYVIVPLREEP